MNRVYCLSLICIAIFSATLYGEAKPESNAGNIPKYEETWESLKKYPAEPDWLKDAKFGIYTCWGPTTYPSSLEAKGWSGWYPRRMYEKSHNNFATHLKHFGDQNKVGYKDLIPLFTAKNFDASAWAKVFKAAGARFAGPLGVHHDNFCMWDSKATRWNSAQMGPKRDITGELAKAIRKEGMKCFVSMHHSFTWNYYYAAYKYDAKDPQYADLYGTPHKPGDRPDKAFMTAWHAKIREVVDQYSPEILYFDWGLGMLPEKDRLKMVAYCYNQAIAKNRDFTIAYKRKDLAVGAGLIDHEVHYPMKKTKHFWLTDTSLSNWYRNKNSKWIGAGVMVDRLIDVVSKNGALVLNVPPDHTGRIPDEAQKILRDIGGWLTINGEAIYNTRPWTIYGYGPYAKMSMKKATAVNWMGKTVSPFTRDDVRFTCSKNQKVIYALVLGKPENREIIIQQLDSVKDHIGSVSLLGHSKPLQWKMTPNGLKVTLPEAFSFQYALALKISKSE